MRATMSILALYNWDQTIFDNLVLPDTIDRNILTYNLLFDCSELELLYPDFDSMKNFIGIWSNKELQTWERIADAAAYEYNPIENYNRSETWTEPVFKASNNIVIYVQFRCNIKFLLQHLL